ncbi:hypothetical protein [Chryseobacterium sp. JV558]|uniref:hypothetical protein n=1 Tax=Chryseobacterium sp. JV558 TaxID=2663236 RepID=UPI00299EE777|nr:hypothetical protein [Chryseobacterium sp. JV558]MDW9381941.1 hypothetical protein [Chryseobacterium sp. JV558]
MNLEEARQKIRLYRKLNEQSRSFRHKDYDHFYELYSTEDLDSVQEILTEYEQIKVSDVINPENEFFKFYGANYADKYLVERTESGFKIHFEFSDILFYELLNFFKEDIQKFIEIVPREFSFYSLGNNSYQIPYNVYQDFFTRLENEDIKEAIKFLNRTVTFSIVSDYEHISTNIYISRINDYLNYLERYNY